jgi:chemotaxis protein MotB
MARKPEPEKAPNHERWLVSYADFITLLFAFFVVMYAVSSVNEGKFKVLSESMQGTFNGPAKRVMPVVIGDEPMKSINFGTSQVELAPLAKTGEQELSDGTGTGDAQEEIEQMQKEAEAGLSELIEKNLLTVTGNEMWFEIELKSGLLFESGNAEPTQEAVTLINEVAKVIKTKQNPINVEGYTDNIPIHNEEFTSNWELSAARSAAIVNLLVQAGVAPQRLAAVGYGEFRPIASNDNEEGRKANRRVVLVVSRDLTLNRELGALGQTQANQMASDLSDMMQKKGNKTFTPGEIKKTLLPPDLSLPGDIVIPNEKNLPAAPIDLSAPKSSNLESPKNAQVAPDLSIPDIHLDSSDKQKH